MCIKRRTVQTETVAPSGCLISVTLARIGSTVADPVRRVSSSLHKCSTGAAKLEKVQPQQV
jgi:hypothetical protein